MYIFFYFSVFKYLIDNFANFSKGKFETCFNEIPIRFDVLNFILLFIELNSYIILLFKILFELLFLFFENKILLVIILLSFLTFKIGELLILLFLSLKTILLQDIFFLFSI